VTDIAAIGKVCEREGADGLTVANTFLGMRIDLKTGKPVLANTFGGFSGPAVFPLALRAVWQVSHACGIPVIGCGGISSGRDVLEMQLAGAAAVQVGAANLRDPQACIKIIQELCEML
jgi:dihydroorotate dehydrogenase (NAD+) catalytic subunit